MLVNGWARVSAAGYEVQWSCRGWPRNFACRLLLAVIFLLPVIPAAAQVPKFHFRMPGAVLDVRDLEGLSGAATEPMPLEALITSFADNVNGWSMAIAPRDISVLELQDATFAGTVIDSLFGGVIDGVVGGSPGAGFVALDQTSTAVLYRVQLDTAAQAALPAGTHTVLRLSAIGTFPEPEVTVQSAIEFADNVQGPQGAVSSQVQIIRDGALEMIEPIRSLVTVRLTGYTCSDSFDLEMSAAGSLKQGGVNRLAREVHPGAPVSIDVQSVIHSHLSPNLGDGVQGWSLGLAYDPSRLELLSSTTASTAVDTFFLAGFNRLEMVQNEFGTGVIAAVVLSLTQKAFLPPSGAALVLRSRYRVLPAELIDGNRIQTRVEYLDGLQGSGRPVRNVVTFQGRSHRPCTVIPLALDLSVRKLEASPFLRGDANDDHRIDLSDAIWILQELFQGGPETSCYYAADANGDGSKDLSDPVFIVEYQFLGGPDIPAPFPACGLIPEELPELCPPGSTQCQGVVP